MHHRYEENICAYGMYSCLAYSQFNATMYSLQLSRKYLQAKYPALKAFNYPMNHSAMLLHGCRESGPAMATWTREQTLFGLVACVIILGSFPSLGRLQQAKISSQWNPSEILPFAYLHVMLQFKYTRSRVSDVDITMYVFHLHPPLCPPADVFSFNFFPVCQHVNHVSFPAVNVILPPSFSSSAA